MTQEQEILQFDDKPQATIIPLGFNYATSNLIDIKTETISTATFSIIDTQSKTPITNMLSGSAMIHGFEVTILVQAGTIGHTYELSALANTSGGKTIKAKGIFKVIL